MDYERTVVRALAAIACTLVLSVTGCVAYTNTLVASNLDPVGAACAMGTSEKACVAYAGRK